MTGAEICERKTALFVALRGGQWKETHDARPLLDTRPWRGRLAIAARPRGGDWLDDEASGWRRAGIDIIVSLLEADEAAQLDLVDEAKAAKSNGIRFTSFPIPDREVPASAPAAISLIAAISDALKTGDNVAVHCRQGVGRSGLIAAGVLASAGIDPERAIEVVSSARGQTVPETPGQRSWIRRLPSGPRVEVPQPR